MIRARSNVAKLMQPTLAAQQMQCSGTGEPLLLPGEGLAHQILLLQMHLADRHQTLQRRNHRPAFEPVGTAQHPLQLKHHRDRHKTRRAGIDQIGHTASLFRVVAPEQPHQQVASRPTGSVMARWVVEDPPPPNPSDCGRPGGPDTAAGTAGEWAGGSRR